MQKISLRREYRLATGYCLRCACLLLLELAHAPDTLINALASATDAKSVGQFDAGNFLVSSAA